MKSESCLAMKVQKTTAVKKETVDDMGKQKVACYFFFNVLGTIRNLFSIKGSIEVSSSQFCISFCMQQYDDLRNNIVLHSKSRITILFRNFR